VSSLLISILAFVVALAILITVHELGHFWVARKLGVKVLRFSVGFGKPIWSRQSGPDATELVVAAVPLGGYVKMLDEREGDVPAEDRDRAFNRQSLASRSAIVAAGPIVNFFFAIFAYWLMFVVGVPGIRPIVGEVTQDSIVAQAGVRAGDEIRAVDGDPTPTWDTVLVALLQGALNERTVQLQVQGESGEERGVFLELGKQANLLDDQDLLTQLGLKPWRPLLPAVIDRLVPDGAAERSGLLPDDRVVAADGVPIEDWQTWVDIVRSHPEQSMRVSVERGGEVLVLNVQPDRAETGEGEVVGRIGAYVTVPQDAGNQLRTEVRYGPLGALGPAFVKTWDMSVLTIKTLWKMVAGQVSVRNISGPLAIAEYAGHSASIGLGSFLGFLALVSISLGVLNLLPIPVLDGGHLMYYLIEFLKGSPVSEQVQALGQQIGIAALLALMLLAFYNDLIRLLG